MARPIRPAGATAWLLAGLIILALWATVARAAPGTVDFGQELTALGDQYSPRCDALGRLLTLGPTTVSIEPRLKENRDWITLNGSFTLTSGPDSWRTEALRPDTICRAAVGAVEVEDRRICDAFPGEFGRHDRLQRTGGRLEYRLIAEQPRKANWLSVRLERPAGSAPCAKDVEFRIFAPTGGTIWAVLGRPDSMRPDLVTWRPEAWLTGAPFRLSVNVDDPPPLPASRQATRGPASLRNGTSEGLTRVWGALIAAPVAVTAIFAAIALFGGIPFMGGQAGPDFSGVRRALTVAAALYTSGKATSAAQDIARIYHNEHLSWTMLRALPAGSTPSHWLTIHPPNSSETSTIAMTAALLGACLLVLLALCVGRRLFGVAKGIQARAIAAILQSLTLGVGLAAVVAATAAPASALVPAQFPYEPVALVVSLLVALVAAIGLKPLMGWGWRVAAGTALALCATIFFPAAPVLLSSGNAPSAVENGLVWFSFLTQVSAPCVLVTALAVLAARAAAQPAAATTAGQHPRALLTCFVLSVAAFDIQTPLAAALLLVGMAAAQLILRPGNRPALYRTSQPLGGAPWAWALGTGAAAAVILWLQLSHRTSNDPAALQLGALLTVSTLYNTGVIAGLGALLLTRFPAVIRGQAGVAKALLLACVALVANMATGADFVLNTRKVLPVFVAMLPVATALLGAAIIAYDLPRARQELTGATLRQKLSGEGLPSLLALASGVAVAVATAVSPVLIKTLSAALTTLLTQSLPHALGGS